MSKRLVLLACVVMILGIVSAPAIFADIIINADESCRTSVLEPEANNHDSSKLSVRSDEKSAKSWIKFDISELDVSSLETATLTVSLHDPKSGDRHFDISYVNDNCLDNIDWDERSITWNNAPGNNTADLGGLDTSKTTLLTTVNFSDGVPGDSFTIDVFEALQTDTDGIVQFVCHNSNGLLNLATHDHAEETWRPFIVAIERAKDKASNPEPANGTTEVNPTPVLSWIPGEYVEGLSPMHKVFFSEDFNDVNEGIGGVTQDASDYPAPGSPLDFGKTYYWRVDEANLTTGWDEGDIWQFTIELFAYAIPSQKIIATASSQAENQGPENTVNGSGLVGNLHSNVLEDMWLTAIGEPAPAWIQYDFDKAYKLHEMFVWNYNGQSFLTAAGLKDVIVEYSSDGTNWMQIDSVYEFVRASGLDDYAPNTTVAFEGIPVKSVKITANSNWSSGLADQFGLSEVQFLQIPVNAREPSPDDGATEVAIDTSLSWRSGREAAEHKVYLSTDQQAVTDGTASATTVNQPIDGPLSLDLGSMYYWRVDEVNNLEAVQTWLGDVWNFTTQEYLVVEDFESYNDIPEGQEGSHLVYVIWQDGYANPATNGSTMGYISGASMETDIVYGGNQSAPLIYDNRTASKSEVTVSTINLPIGSDWTIGAPDTLVLWFHGDPNNAVSSSEQLYVKLNNSKLVINGIDLTQATWQNVEIPLADFGINLANITQLVIGLERTGATGSEGILFMDDIWLYKPASPQLPQRK